MHDIERQLRLFKPKVPELRPDFCERVQLRIDGLQLQPHKVPLVLSRWVKIGFGVLLLVSCLLLIDYIIFAMQMSGGLELLSFGLGYMKDSLNYVPLDLIGLTLVMTAGAAWVIQNSKFFKLKFLKLAIGSYLVVGTGGVALAASGVNEQIQNWAINKETQKTILSQLYLSRAKYEVRHSHFKMGQIVSKTDDKNIWIINPRGEKVKISMPANGQFKVGDYIKFSGDTIKGEFQAQEFRRCGPSTINRLFHQMKNHNHHNPGMMKKHGMMKNHGMMRSRM